MAHEDDGSEPVALDLVISDPGQVPHLRDWIREQSGVRAVARPGAPGPGELGSLTVLSILAGSSGVVTAIKTLPAFLRSRRSGVRIETTYRGEPFVLDATNVDEVLPLLERLLDD
jgi:Effector Associated Constant Component 1